MTDTLILIVGMVCFALTVLGVVLTIREFNRMQQ